MMAFRITVLNRLTSAERALGFVARPEANLRKSSFCPVALRFRPPTISQLQTADF